MHATIRKTALLLIIVAALRAANPSVEPAKAQAIVRNYCVGCHNEKVKTGGVALDAVSATAVAPGADTWEKVLRKVRTGEMPPLGLPRPDVATTAGFTSWLEAELDRAAIAKPNPGAPVVRRLNRAEYGNAVRDLLALDLDHGSSLPADNSGHGFDNIGSVLNVSPLHMEKYMSAARRVSRLAIGTVRLSPAIERFVAPRGTQNETPDELPLSVRGGIVVKRYFPLDAEYSIVVRVRGNPAPNVPQPKLDVRVDGRRVKLIDLDVNPAEEAQGSRNNEIRLPLTAGMHVIGAGVLTETLKAEGGGQVGRRGAPPPQVTPVAVENVIVAGPFDTTGPGDTDSRKRIFVCRPLQGQLEEPCARRIVTTLARRAYRRPVTVADVAPLMLLFASGRKEGGSFDAGIEKSLRGILVAPGFLFRVERAPRATVAGAIYRVTDIELASRLSFFLWSSIPDDELLRLAETGKLRPVLAQQVRRMLADPKAKSLVDNFAGQWLHLRNVAGWKPDPVKYPQFDDPLRAALQRETELLFRYIIREDQSVIDLITADYSFLNERLARHYGIDGVKGSYFRRVALTGPERGGGILTHGSILTVTSYPTRTSPVLRGKWILENVLGAPPPPPPPDVPDLADSATISAKDLRAALEKHRENASCASCHSRLDPLGFALENYDAVGRFRSKEGDAEIDASSSLPGGTTFRGATGLKDVLLERRDDFVECLAEKMLTYALGRGLEHYDRAAIRQIRRRASAEDYRFSALVLAVADSVPFQMRRTPEP